MSGRGRWGVRLTFTLLLGLLGFGLAGAGHAAPSPTFELDRAGVLSVVAMPEILARREVRAHLDSGLTTSFVLAVTVRDGEGREVVGTGKVEILYELWDEVYLVRITGNGGARRRVSARSFEELMTVWKGLHLPLARVQGRRWRPRRPRRLRWPRVRSSSTEGYAATAFGSVEEAEGEGVFRGSSAVDLLVLDVRLPGESGVSWVRRLADAGRLPPTIVLSGEASIGETVEALQLGVHDFLEKPVRRERLLRSIENALAHAALTARVAALESRVAGVPEILGRSAAIERLRLEIQKVAATEARVLVRGESGVGKELVAAAVRAASRRRGGPLVKVNCAALPPHLIEDELFGHARGAFTDAKAARAGLFEEAHGGTLFLDEIGDLDLSLQGRLLSVLEDGRVRRLGESRERAFEVRIVAATHRPLEDEVAAGRFRQDLYFRLAHLPLDVPPLRERAEDVPLLFDHFVERFADRHRLRRRTIDPTIHPPLAAYCWPGNVRELSNLCERLGRPGFRPARPRAAPRGLFRAAPRRGGRSHGTPPSTRRLAAAAVARMESRDRTGVSGDGAPAHRVELHRGGEALEPPADLPAREGGGAWSHASAATRFDLMRIRGGACPSMAAGPVVARGCLPRAGSSRSTSTACSRTSGRSRPRNSRPTLRCGSATCSKRCADAHPLSRECRTPRGLELGARRSEPEFNGSCGKG